MKKFLTALLIIILILACSAGAALYFNLQQYLPESVQEVLPESLQDVLPEPVQQLLSDYFPSFSEVSSDDADCYAVLVSDLMASRTNSQIQNRYSGVVQTAQTQEIAYDETKTVSTLFVQKGDSVSAGDALFEYDTADQELSLEAARLELDRIASQIDGYNKQIETLTAEKAKASQAQQLDYTIQIQTVEASIKEAEYNQKSKQTEIERIEKSIANNTVYATLDGIVQEINENPGYDSSGNRKPYMTIIAQGDVLIKGTVSEMNVGTLYEGQTVIIRSRVDEDQTWSGIITRIDLENQVTSSYNYYYMGDSDNSSTKYPFYVSPDYSDGLMLGQHVYIEPDFGQQEVKEGLWISSDYIVMDDNGDAYVWMADSTSHLKKQSVVLGEFDYDLWQYQILEGLTEEDFIVYPDESCQEGASVYCRRASDLYS